MDAFDGVIGAAAFDSGPLDDGSGRGAQRVAHVGLLEDFLGTGPGAAISEELFSGEMGALGAVDDIEETEFDGVGHGDAVVEVPGGVGILDF